MELSEEMVRGCQRWPGDVLLKSDLTSWIQSFPGDLGRLGCLLREGSIPSLSSELGGFWELSRGVDGVLGLGTGGGRKPCE